MFGSYKIDEQQPDGSSKTLDRWVALVNMNPAQRTVTCRELFDMGKKMRDSARNTFDYCNYLSKKEGKRKISRSSVNYF